MHIRSRHNHGLMLFGLSMIGITKEHHVERNAAAVAIKIPDDVLAKLNDATDELKQAMGSNADLWQGNEDGRIK